MYSIAQSPAVLRLPLRESGRFVNRLFERLPSSATSSSGETLMPFGIRVRITHKIAAIGAIGFGGLALVGGIYLTGDTRQEHYRVIAADALALSDRVDRLGRELLESRRAEKDFLLRSDEKYALRHAELAKSVEEDFDALGR